jgi:serine protease Do
VALDAGSRPREVVTMTMKTHSLHRRRHAVMTSLALAMAISVTTAAASPTAALSSDAIADAAEAVVDSVVNVSSTADVSLGPAELDPMFSDPRSPFYLSPDQRKRRSAGSGVIVSAKGRILTNAHVVHGADEILVTLGDGTELDAKVIGVDRASDLAVLELQGQVPALRPLPFGDSSKLRLGEIVLAVGNPFGVGQAVTMGIVSAQGRASLGIVDYEDFIQTDAAINPGNSGGALVNLRGELVGINTAILSRTGGYDGIGFAIPSNMAEPIMNMLIKDGKVSRGYIGVMLSPLTRDWIKEHKPSVKRGVVVTKVVDDGPAARAGIKAHDIIVAVDGKSIDDVGRLRNAIAMKGAGANVDVTIVRGDGRETVSMKTRELPTDGAAAEPARTKKATDDQPKPKPKKKPKK